MFFFRKMKAELKTLGADNEVLIAKISLLGAELTKERERTAILSKACDRRKEEIAQWTADNAMLMTEAAASQVSAAQEKSRADAHLSQRQAYSKSLTELQKEHEALQNLVSELLEAVEKAQAKKAKKSTKKKSAKKKKK